MDEGASPKRTTLIDKIKGFLKNASLHDDVTEEEIISMVNEGHEQGVLLASEAAMINNIFEFGDKPPQKSDCAGRRDVVSRCNFDN